jgi:hypothetical protein
VSDQLGNFWDWLEKRNHRVTTASADRPLKTQLSTAAPWLGHASAAGVTVVYAVVRVSTIHLAESAG